MEDSQVFDQQIAAANQRLHELMERSGRSPEQESAIGKALSASLEELHAAGQKLRRQNEELLAARQVLEAERRQAKEEAFSLSRFLSENPNPVLRLDQAGSLLYANEASGPVLREWGCQVGDLLPPPWRDMAVEAFAESTARTVDIPSGERLYSFDVVPIAEAGYVNLYGRDVTAHWQAESQREAALAERESLLAQVQRDRQSIAALAQTLERERDTLQTIMESTHAHLAYLDIDFNFVRVNSAYAQGSGHSPEEIIGHNHFDLFPDAENQAIFEQVRDSGQPVVFHAKPFEYADQPERGVSYWDWSLVPVKEEDGQVRGLVLSLLDVTHQARAEQERERHVVLLDTLIRVSQEILAEKTAGGLLQHIVQAARELTAARIGVTGHGYRNGVFEVGAASRAEDVAPCPPEAVSTVQRGGVYLELIKRATATRLADEQLRARPAWWGLPEGHAPLRGLLGVRLVESDERANGLIMVSDKEQGDFTAEDEALLTQLAAVASLALQHIQARSEAERRADELNAVFTSINEAVIVFDANRRVARANPAANAIYGAELAGADRAMVAQKLFLRHPNGRPVMAHELAAARAQRGEQVRGKRFILTSADGRDVNILTSAAPLLADGRPVGSVVVWHDITERERLLADLAAEEEKLKAALAENEVLMREIYHRVKNNIQTLISLMDMQAEFIVDPDSREMIHELQVRVRTMSLVHEQLYQSGNLDQINFGDYLNDLVANLSRAFWADRPIVWTIDAADVLLGVDTAIPCGLIVNELLTNALKYAFPNARPVVERGETECKIRVEFRAEGDRFRLVVADNGVGLPPGLDWAETSSLGLQLINVLACHQLGGQVEVDTQAGTTFKITFVERKKR